jgi:tRNA (guanine26-N2/guanine27-N2)-dimethyltransferase
VVKSEFAHEAALRVLFGFCARIGGVVDIGIEPVAAHTTLHYLRVYFRVERGPAKADRSLKDVGYVATCASCHDDTVTAAVTAACPKCESKARSIGPMWVGRLFEEETRAKAADVCSKLGWKGAASALEALEGANAFPPFGFSMEAITSREKMSSVRFQKVVDSLKASGRLAMRQPFGLSGLKTDASYQEVLAAVRLSAN